MNRLANTHCYLSGPIESCADGGTNWRKHVMRSLAHLGVQWLDPCNKPTKFVSETPEDNKRLCRLREAGDFDAVQKEMLWIRRVDLRMVHPADFLIVYLDRDVPTCGTWEEIVWANQETKPILIVYAQGKEKAPLWLFGMLPHQMIFSTWTELEDYLNYVDHDPRLNTEQITLWSDNRWHLFSYHGA